MKKNVITPLAILACFLFHFNFKSNAQVKLTSASKFQIGYGTYTPITLGSYPAYGVNNGRWNLEYWNNAISAGVGGLNFFIPWPNPGATGTGLFLRDNNGHVGIGRIPSYILDVNGTIRVSDQLISSDEKLKKNIVPISSALSKLSKLQGKFYDKKTGDFRFNSDSINDETKLRTLDEHKNRTTKDGEKYKPEFGFIAQEVKEVFPELVSVDEFGTHSINYISLIPIAIEAIKEQNAKIDSIQKLLNKTHTNATTNSNLNTGLSDINKSTVAQLKQNIPNPFTQSTSISFTISTLKQSAMLNIYNMQGTEIKSYPVTRTGEQSVTINGSELNPGMYMYTLIVDGQEIDTKRMILTR